MAASRLGDIGGAVHPVGNGSPVLLWYRLDQVPQAGALADGDREAGIHPAAVFGDAWPLTVEWRGLKDTHPNRGSSLSWLVTEGRVLSVELALLEEHGMTLPPETYPLRGFDRNGQLNWRRTALYDTRRARAKRELLRWVRRALTLGLWRK